MSLGPSYLCLAGNEISNGMRTLVYLLRGLGGSEFDVSTVGGVDPSRLVSGYSDVYSDLYAGDVSFASLLSCYCADLDDPTNFVSPATDPAPWYDVARPGDSGDFLGIIFDSVDLGTGAGRNLTQRASGGGSIGRLRTTPRIMQFHGFMYAKGDRGMAYGERWLNKVLHGSMCGDCGGDTAEVLPACGSDDGRSPFRTLYEVGLVDGPVPTPITGVGGPGNRMQEVSFQLAAGNPYFHQPYAFPSAPTTFHVANGTAQSTEILTTEWMGEVAPTLSITAEGDLYGFAVQAVPLRPDQTCGYDPALTPANCARYVVIDLADGDTLTINATNRRVTVEDLTSKSVRSGFDALEFDGPFPWLAVPPCSRVCLSFVAAGYGAATVNLRQEEREL